MAKLCFEGVFWHSHMVECVFSFEMSSMSATWESELLIFEDIACQEVLTSVVVQATWCSPAS